MVFVFSDDEMKWKFEKRDKKFVCDPFFDRSLWENVFSGMQRSLTKKYCRKIFVEFPSGHKIDRNLVANTQKKYYKSERKKNIKCHFFLFSLTGFQLILHYNDDINLLYLSCFSSDNKPPVLNYRELP